MAAKSSAVAAAGLTVSVAGTSLSSGVDSTGYFQLKGVPSGTARLQFTDAGVNATLELTNVGRESLIEIQVQLTGTSAVVVDEVRSNSKVSLCHGTGNGSYHMIDISTDAESAHRAHGDGKVGDAVPGEPTKTFDEHCRAVGPSVKIEKFTNGEDANDAPGPAIPVGSTVTWTYRVTNTGTVPLTNVMVTDDQGVTVSCTATTLNATQSMTCTGTGFAVAGQYRNVGRVTANYATGSVADTDPSHYFGIQPTSDDGPKVQLCHKTGNGKYVLIDVSVDAEPAHRAHGDGKIGEAVPGSVGKTFGTGCSVN